jgi:hypothetical protein
MGGLGLYRLYEGKSLTRHLHAFAAIEDMFGRRDQPIMITAPLRNSA